MKVISHPFCACRCRSCATDQLYLPWRAARAAGSAVPSSAQQLCLCFLGSRVALFRIGCLVQLQQSLRSLVLLLRMRRLRSQRLQCSVWPPARSKTVPSSAQRHCLCFLGARVALFRIGWLVQLQLQSLRSLVLLLRMRRLRLQRLQCSVWPPVRSKTVPSSAQRHCLCFLGARVALFRIGWLVQLQLQSLRSIVVLCACSSGSGLLRL